MASESLSAELTQKREETKAFFDSLATEDAIFIKGEAQKYSDNPEKQQAFVDGYMFSINNPHSKSVHLISMFTLDLMPHCKTSIKFATKKIWNGFRQKLYNLE